MPLTYGDEIKSRLTMKEVVNMYGFRVEGKTGKILCPFHNDTKPSMQIYPGHRGYFCFVCGQGGSVIDFVMKYFNLSFTDACKKLNDDFRLGIPIGEELTEQQKREAAEAVRKRQEELRQKEKKEQQLFTAYHAALDRYCMLDRMKMENEPRKGADGKYRITKAYVYVIKRIDAAWAEVEEAAARLREFEKGETET